MVEWRDIGIKMGILEHQVIGTYKGTYKIDMFIWRMMRYRSIIRGMGGMKRGIRSLLKNFKITSTFNTSKKLKKSPRGPSPATNEKFQINPFDLTIRDLRTPLSTKVTFKRC